MRNLGLCIIIICAYNFFANCLRITTNSVWELFPFRLVTELRRFEGVSFTAIRVESASKGMWQT